MKLHEDRDAFRVLIEDIHNRTGYRSDVLEKDYYVVLILSELAEKQQNGLPAYFKGGTALYKAVKSTNRFSNDTPIWTKQCLQIHIIYLPDSAKSNHFVRRF